MANVEKEREIREEVEAKKEQEVEKRAKGDIEVERLKAKEEREKMRE